MNCGRGETGLRLAWCERPFLLPARIGDENALALVYQLSRGKSKEFKRGGGGERPVSS
ncbi:protein of unknown function [Methylocaldum szegediense]|uniref:Uncharacterized protein n=1 Tax=Methylocaldum szegediense TaxID=73780 RepID=A0ABM9I4U5_9GAMM|nr:protein of unknown function [Methylocaldum szegediense]